MFVEQPLASAGSANNKYCTGESYVKEHVNFEIKCLTCKETEEDSGPLTTFFKAGNQSSQTFKSKHKMVPEEKRKDDMFHVVGPPGLYSIKCHKKNDKDYVGEEEEAQPRLALVLTSFTSHFNWKIHADYI